MLPSALLKEFNVFSLIQKDLHNLTHLLPSSQSFFLYNAVATRFCFSNTPSFFLPEGINTSLLPAITHSPCPSSLTSTQSLHLSLKVPSSGRASLVLIELLYHKLLQQLVILLLMMFTIVAVSLFVQQLGQSVFPTRL